MDRPLKATKLLPALVAAAGLVAGGCGEPGQARLTDVPHAAGPASQRSSAPGPSATAAAPALPTILNPYEEIQEFAPDGILRWSEVPGADAYEVWAYEYRYPEGMQLVEFSAALASRQYQFTKLAGGGTYYLRLHSRIGGSWNETPQFTVRTTSDVVKPRLANPQDEIEALGDSAVLRWNAVPGAEKYELWIFGDKGLGTFIETSGPVRETQYRVRNLAPGRTYYAQVFSLVGGVFHAGGALPVTVAAESRAARILNPQEELDAFAPTGMLRWTPVTGATSYEAWIFTNANASEIYESSGSLTTRSYAARTLEPASTYYVQVYALVNGQWQVGAPIRVRTAPQVTIARLTNAQEELEGFGTSGTLRWTEVPGADRYEAWIYGNAGLGIVADVGMGTGLSYEVSRLCKGGTYYVQVYARAGGQWSTGWATPLTVTQGESPASCVPPAPTAKVSASATEVRSGEGVTLRWASQFAATCTASGAWTGPKAASGEETVGPLTTRALYSLVCSGPNGSALAQALVTIAIPQYEVAELGSVPGYTGSWGRSVNDSGQVAGWVVEIAAGTRPSRPFLYGGGHMSLVLPPRTGGTAHGINEAGQVVGQSATAFLASDGSVIHLGTLGGTSSSALGINAAGQVVGWSTTPVPGVTRAFSHADGVMTDLGTLGGASSWAYGVNDAGQIVGTSDNPAGERHAFLLSGGTMSDLGTLKGGSSVAYAINATGGIAGSADGHAFRYVDGVMEDLGTFGGAESAAYGINDHGEIVGAAESAEWSWNSANPSSSGPDEHAFLYTAGSMYDLNDQLVQPQGGLLSDARAINERGQIIANRCSMTLLSGGTPFTHCWAVLLTPVEGTAAQARQ